MSESAQQAFEAVFCRYLPDTVELSVIHNFVDTQQFTPSPDRRTITRRKLDIPHDALVLGSVGRLEDQKRPESIVRLFAQLRPQFPNLYLILAGQGSLEQTVRRLAESLGVASHVRFMGFIQETETVYPAFDLHVLLSRNEGFGISTIEAMSCGIPVIGTDVPGTRDILKDTRAGLLVPLNDEGAAIKAASQVLHDLELRRSLSAAARNLACRRYAKAIWADKIAEFYAHVLSKVDDRQFP